MDKRKIGSAKCSGTEIISVVGLSVFCGLTLIAGLFSLYSIFKPVENSYYKQTPLGALSQPIIYTIVAVNCFWVVGEIIKEIRHE